MLAMGHQRVMGVFSGGVYSRTSRKIPAGETQETATPWSSAVPLAAAVKLIGRRPFQEILFKNGLPWIFVFAPAKDHGPDDGTVVVAGDLTNCFDAGKLLFRNVRLAKDATLSLENPKGEFLLIDSDGNPVTSQEPGRLTIPLDTRGFYLRTNQSPGSFARLLDALRRGKLHGLEPVDIQVRDFLSPVGPGASLRVTVSNVLNEPIEGPVQISAPTITSWKQDTQTLRLAPHESRTLVFEVAEAKPDLTNAHPVTLTADFGAAGGKTHREMIRVNQIARRTVRVDGDLSDWKNVLPHTVRLREKPRSATEAAWLPFLDDDAAKDENRDAQTFFAWDDRALYFAARIPDDTPNPGMPRFANLREEDYFYPETVRFIDRQASFGMTTHPASEVPAVTLPGPACWKPRHDAMAFDLSLPPDRTVEGTLHFVAPPRKGGGEISLVSPKTGATLAVTRLRPDDSSARVRFVARGDIRVIVRIIPRFGTVLCGMFLDEAPREYAATTKAAFLEPDGEKENKGQLGRWIAGDDKPAGEIAIHPVDTEIVSDLQWPDGVRRYSYRSRPELPSGMSPKSDNVQIAFNALPDEQKPFLMNPAGTMPKFMVYPDTDYEFALNPVRADYGGGTEVWTLSAPDLPRKHFYPRQPRAPGEGPAQGAELFVGRRDGKRIVEASLPWALIPGVRARLDAGGTVKITVRINDNGGPSGELAEGRSVSKINSLALHDDWGTHWANELEFSFEKP
jgi:hypothetical protein